MEEEKVMSNGSGGLNCECLICGKSISPLDATAGVTVLKQWGHSCPTRTFRAHTMCLERKLPAGRKTFEPCTCSYTEPATAIGGTEAQNPIEHGLDDHIPLIVHPPHLLLHQHYASQNINSYY
jgi:hypothetical protein